MQDDAKRHEKEIKKILPIIHIAREWAAVKENELHDLSQIIEWFDKGYAAVSLIDAKGNFSGLINKFDFKEDFAKRRIRGWTDLCVEYEEDELSLKRKLAEMYLDTPRTEVPILKDGKIVALGRLTNYFDIYGCWDAKRAFRFSWSWIDEAVAKEFFVARRKILISSECGFLEGFWERFASWLDITVYDGSVRADSIREDFDLMICGSDAMEAFPLEQWEAHRLFYMLLVETVRRWLNQRGVEFYFFSSAQQTVPGIEQMLDRQGELLGGTLGFFRCGEVPCFVCDGNGFDTVLEEHERMPNFHAGRRCVTESEEIRGNGVYFYGTCTAVGWASYSPDKTIESFLQKLINREKLDYHVVNCATEGLFEWDSACVNWLYRLMDTPFSCGDIAVVITNSDYFWDRDKKFVPYNLEYLATPFIMQENEDKKCFAEPMVGHMNVMGCEIEAEYIFKMLAPKMKNLSKGSERKAFFSMYPAKVRRGSNLERWLRKLPQRKAVDGMIAGAVIMHADPLTKGHMHMIEEVLRKCEFLYIFLLESENDLLPIGERQEIMASAAVGMPAAIINAGKCMRQSYVWNMPLQTFITSAEESFDPVYDTYTFARHIAPRLHISKYFVGEEPFDRFERRYNIIRREMILEEGVEWIEIPRKRLDDGRDIITDEIRKLWMENGWQACRDFLPEAEIEWLEQRENAK